MNYKVTVLGAGLAGCEAALWLAGKGVQVDLYEQKPVHFSPAHKSAGFAEPFLPCFFSHTAAIISRNSRTGKSVPH